MNEKILLHIPVSEFKANAFSLPVRPRMFKKGRVQIDLGWRNLQLAEGEVMWDGSEFEANGTGAKLWLDREDPLMRRWMLVHNNPSQLKLRHSSSQTW